MKHSQKPRNNNRTVGSAFLITGLITAMLGVGNVSPMQGQLLQTNQGSLAGTAPIRELLIEQGTILPAAPEIDTANIGMIAFGALMMLLGFGLHALIVLQTQQEELPVPVRKKKQDKAFPRTSRKQMDVIWVERTIRL